MTRYKWPICFILGLIAPWSALVGYNVISDPYGLFREDMYEQIVDPNQVYKKLQHVIDNPSKYDTYLFGSSRVGNIYLRPILGDTAYNFTYSEGVPSEHLANIKSMLAHNVNIKHIVIGLDDFSYQLDASIHNDQYSRKLHPKASGEFWVDFYAFYFFRTFSDIDIQHLFTKGYKDYIYFDIANTGNPICEICEFAVENFSYLHNSANKFTKPFSYYGDRIDTTVQTMKEIISLSEKHDFQLTLFFNPLHKTTYINSGLSQSFVFKRKLAKIHPFYDFQGINFVTSNNMYYYETSHYRPIIGSYMLDIMFRNQYQFTVSDSFGVKVDTTNVESHIGRLVEEIRTDQQVWKAFLVDQKVARYRKKVQQQVEDSPFSAPEDLKQKGSQPLDFCSIDKLSNRDIEKTNHVIKAKEASFSISGWAHLPQDYTHEDSLFIKLTKQKNKQNFYIPAMTGLKRDDVADFFNDPKLTNSGFFGEYPTTYFDPGIYNITFIFNTRDRKLICNTDSVIEFSNA